MELNEKDEIAMKQYLLGELAQPELQQLEERLMTDNETFERLLLLEDELVDEYVRGALTAHEQERFDRHFLSTPDRHQKVRFAGALRKYVSEASVPEPSASTLPVQRPVSFWQSMVAFLCSQRPVLEWSLGAALLLIVVGGSWSTVKISRLQNQIEQMRAQQATPQGQTLHLQQQLAELRSRNDQLTNELQREQSERATLQQELAALKTQGGPGDRPTPQPGPSLPSMVTFALTPGLVRDMGSTKKLSVPPGTKLVQLQLDLPADDYNKYRAVLQNAEGGEISSQTLPKPKTPDNDDVFHLILPAYILPPGDYSVKLSGINANGDLEDLAKYSFRVVKK
jgi:chorismate mutase